MYKGFYTGGKQAQLLNNQNNVNGNGISNLYEYVDVQREMGEFLPSEI